MKRTPTPQCRTVLLAALCLLMLTLSILISNAAAPWGTPIMQAGIAAATCAGPTQDSSGNPVAASAAYVFGLVDLRGPAATDYGDCQLSAPLWIPPMFHDASWNAENLGNVYGITIDADGDIYLAAHGLYGAYRPLHHRYGNLGGGAASLSAAGTVYKIDRLTGAATVFAVIPGQQVMALSGGLMSGPGLGNITYDADHDQFFVTSLEDGKIYRVSNTGSVLGSFDPMMADDGAAGLPPLRERLWAIEVERGAVFYSVWNSGSTADPAKIRRVTILPSGALDPSSDVEVLAVPGKPSSWSHSVPVSDLTFSTDGKTMILGERTMQQPTYSYNHNSSTHLATLTGAAWTVTKTLATGCNSVNGEGYGGVAFGDESGNPEGTVWTTSADMRDNGSGFNSYGPHGLFGVRTVDFPVSGKAAHSWKVPYDPSFLNTWINDVKGSGGDVEIMRTKRCARFAFGEIACPDKANQPFNANLTITNLTTTTAVYAVLSPCPAPLPAGVTTGQPLPTGVITLPTAIGTNASTSITVQLPGSPGVRFCFNVTLLTKDGEECCTEKVCVDLPDCGCARVVSRKIDCEVQADGTVKYTIVLGVQNLTNLMTPFPFGHASFLPPTGFSPSLVTPSPNPILPGATGTIKTCFFGHPGPLCFNLVLHDPNFTTCCSLEVCLDLPPCGDVKPDTCAMQSRIACCPPDGVTPVSFTICNNSSVPRSYTWTAAGIVDATCTQTLTAANFTPSSGTLGPIPAGGCLTQTIKVRCSNFAPGDCAAFQICFTHNVSVPPMCCTAHVYRPLPGVPVVKVIDIDPLPVGGVSTVRLEVSNPGDSALRTPLFFFSEDGGLAVEKSGTVGVPVAEVAESVQLAPGQTVALSVQVTRREGIDTGANFAPLALFLGADSLANVANTDAIIIPIVLTKARVAAMRVAEVMVEHEPLAQVVLEVLTERGHRYRVEQSADLGTVWIGSDCKAHDVVTATDGSFLGTGGTVRASVPCHVGEPMMFFRIVDLSSQD